MATDTPTASIISLHPPVLSRPKTASRNHYARTLGCIFDYFFQPRVVISHYRLQLHVNADAIQLIGEPETVGVRAVRRKKFRTDGDDFRCEHERRYLPQRTHKSQYREP